MTATIFEATSSYIIFEQMRPSPLGLPGIPRIPGTAPGLNKLQCMMFMVREEAEVHFEGRALEEHAGFYEWFMELITPGEQITTERTGNRRLIVEYFGFLNVLVYPLQQGRRNLFWVNMLGSDPAPNAILYGRSDINFNSAGGMEWPSAMAFYNSDRNTLREVPTSNRAAMIENFTQTLGR